MGPRFVPIYGQGESPMCIPSLSRPMYLGEIQDALASIGQLFVQIYGQGESPMCITSLGRHWHADTGHPRYLERLASAGPAQSVMQVRITDAEGKPLPAGE